jgi:hypothetical protein
MLTEVYQQSVFLQFISHPRNILNVCISILILSSHLCLRFRSGFFPWGFPTKSMWISCFLTTNIGPLLWSGEYCSYYLTPFYLSCVSHPSWYEVESVKLYYDLRFTNPLLHCCNETQMFSFSYKTCSTLWIPCQSQYLNRLGWVMSVSIGNC